MHYLLTGHTGFKGTWIALLLSARGHKVSGISLDPIEDALFTKIDFATLFANDVRADIRDDKSLGRYFMEIKPDVVIHLAAQPLVRESYKDPITTYDTNILGTLNVLKATAYTNSIKAQLIVTTDKVYENKNKLDGYVESEALGGHDPYSTSKAVADLLTQAWVRNFNSCPTAIARAGNVIGGGDVSPDRLIPDLIYSYLQDKIPLLRYPNSVRPWQHVLDCANGYLKLVDLLLLGKGSGAWNFGPSKSEIKTVAEVSELVGNIWGVRNTWQLDERPQPIEAGLLLLNSEKARKNLLWRDKLDFSESVKWTTNWYKDVNLGVSPSVATSKNISLFESMS